MIIRVSELQDDGLTVEDATQFASPFADRTWRLDALSLHLVPDGPDVVVTGHIESTVPLTCSRCLEVFPARVRASVDVRYAPAPAGAESVELGADDLDVDFYANDQLNLAGLVETETSLALPMKPLCRDDCRGLCPVCGGNRNLVQCECPAHPPDPRLAVLHQLSARMPR
jgi:uncharacterized protein